VGQGNTYRHPKSKFIQAATHTGAAICCSEITEQCMGSQTKRAHVLEGSFQLGLPIPKNSMQCRGAMRVFVDGDGAKFDEFQRLFEVCVKEIEGRLCHE
jgi:hypothetical protein